LDEEVDTEENKKERKGRKAPHELLTDAEKKANHIASEKKRRQNIRLGFDQLIEIVPSLTQGNRSEAFILQKCKQKSTIPKKKREKLIFGISGGSYSTFNQCQKRFKESNKRSSRRIR
jgi:hypothetical protein